LIPLLDLKAHYETIKEEIDKAVAKVIDSTNFILGPEVQALEQETASYCQTKFAIGVASGTDALELTLVACGISAGDEVITTPFSFIATADTIVRAGAKPVFADILSDSFNIDPEKIEEKINSKTKAIMPVHLFGQPAEMSKIMDIAREHGLKVIEDCAQAIGAESNSKRVGSFGDTGCLSFFPSKNLGCFGDGGMVVTNSKEIAENIRLLRKHGIKDKYNSSVIGFNSRLDELQAAVLKVKLKYLDKWTEKRQKVASIYESLLKDSLVKTSLTASSIRHVYNQYTIKTSNRDELFKWLKEKEIGAAIYYPAPFHLQDVFAYLGYKKGDFPEAEKAAKEVISLPIYPELTEEQIKEVVSAIDSS